MRRSPKQKWTLEEEAALQAGVEKHGPGWWRVIQMDPEFRPVLSSRSNIGLKDKWRNLSPKKSKSKAVPARPIPISTPLSSSPPATTPNPPFPLPPATDDERNNLKYAALILEALSILKDPNGTDLNAIYHFIEEKQRGVSSDFRSSISFELEQLIQDDKIEKVSNGYVLKDASFTPMQRDLPLPTQPTQADQIANLLSDLANSYALKIADAEVKLIKAAEAVMEVVRLSKTAEEADSFLQRAENIFEQCFSGEIVDNGFRQHFTSNPGSLHHT